MKSVNANQTRLLRTGKALFLVSVMILLQSCSSSRMGKIELSGESQYMKLFPPQAFKKPVTIAGKAKIEFSRYRFRGIFRLKYDGELVEIAFDHSSVFGAVKEEGSIFISKGQIAVLDEKRGKFYDGEVSKRLIRDATGADIASSDIMLALMLRHPRYSKLDIQNVARGGGRWEIQGAYLDRKLTILGEESLGPVRFDICESGDLWCFTVVYDYGGQVAEGDYPQEIVISKRDGSVRIVLQIDKVTDNEPFAIGSSDAELK